LPRVDDVINLGWEIIKLDCASLWALIHFTRFCAWFLMGKDLAGQGSFKEEKQKSIGKDPMLAGFTLPSHPSNDPPYPGLQYEQNVLLKGVTSPGQD